MIRAMNRLGDRLLNRLVPGATAEASVCWTESCCSSKYCRTCCYQDSTGKTTCGAYDYC